MTQVSAGSSKGSKRTIQTRQDATTKVVKGTLAERTKETTLTKVSRTVINFPEGRLTCDSGITPIQPIAHN